MFHPGRSAAAGVLCLGLVLQMAAPLSLNAKAAGTITINEVCSKNTAYPAPNGSFYDWIELYNGSAAAVDLSGWGITDKASKPYRFTFPAGTSIGAGEHLLLFCDSDAAAADPSIAPFGLSGSGETLTLTDAAGNTADTLTFGSITADTAYGQYPDGSGEFFTLACTPGAANKSPEGSNAVAVPTFSADSGFYDKSFSLTIQAPAGTTVYYTTDGSDPTAEAEKYTAPISIADMSSTPNRLSTRTDISASGADAPSGNVDKAAVIRAVAIDGEGRVSDIVTKTYFLGKTNSGYYPQMKVVSLVTDPDNLFDYETGIYCLGKVYDEENGGAAADPWGGWGGFGGKMPWEMDANYTQKGKAWERVANFTLFDGGEKILEQNVGIRIKGAASRSAAQKSFSIYARRDYGAPELAFDFFDGTATKAKNGKVIDKFERIVLRNGGNDNQNAVFRDSINQGLVSDRSFAYQATNACVVFLDGEFWGLYQITEKLDAAYLHDHFSVDASSAVLLKNGEVEEGSDADLAEWNAFMKGVVDGSISYAQFCEKVDLQSYLDYFAAQIYWVNDDWPNNNTAVWRTNLTDESNPYADGKWRMVLFDTESGQGLYGSREKSADADLFDRIRRQDDDFCRMFLKLLENKDFSQQFARTMMDLANYNFTTDKTQAAINFYKSTYKQQILDTYARFSSRSLSGQKGEQHFNQEYEAITNFYNSRFDPAERTMKQAVGLTSSLHTLTVQNDAKSGSVDLNTLHLGDISEWAGKYHADYDMTLTAMPKAGCAFSHWEISGAELTAGTKNSPTISLNLASDATVKAVYTEAVRGDVNADGTFDVKDLVLFQKWLLRVPDTTLPGASAGDLTGDGVLDVFDLSMMKRELVK